MAHYVVGPKQKKIMSLIFKISGVLVFLCTGATICPKIFLFIVDYCFLIVLKIENAENAPRKSTEIRENLTVRAFSKRA
jgi:hypothetical protein